VATTFDLAGKSILITGAGRGLGRALAIGAAQAGARVSAFDVDAPALLELRKASDAITTYVVDVVDRAAYMDAAGRIGRIDGVVNNAMLIRYDPIEAVDDAILDRMLAIGIKGAVWGVQALLRHMDPQVGGVILNLASPVV
jgi:NAD(P)-dependent dehydrogenase (short-subunit alcohol dehydrogenase family)